MNLDLEAMKAAALAAGGKKWIACHDTYMCDGGGDWTVNEKDSGFEVAYVEHDHDSPTAKHIAASCPAAVLALIERLEGAESALASTIEKLSPTKGDVVVLRTSGNTAGIVADHAARIHAETGALVLIADSRCSVEMVESASERAANTALIKENDRLQRRLDAAEAELARLRSQREAA